ncbi:MAG TPA: dihydrofolate reductase family protein, partial [Chitinophagaceae bacterium]|nr:dihydrofolate reductase family protein [Chitinophagaceae bacterium]
MRKLIFAINISLDGCCDHTKMTPTEDIHDYFTQLIRDAGLLVYGRKTYELMVPFWPDMAKKQSAPTKALNDFALAFDATPKVVFSKTLDNVEDKNTTVIRTGLTEEILRLKQVEGKDILLGGVTLS